METKKKTNFSIKKLDITRKRMWGMNARKKENLSMRKWETIGERMREQKIER